MKTILVWVVLLTTGFAGVRAGEVLSQFRGFAVTGCARSLAHGLKFERFTYRNARLRFVVPLHQGNQFIQLRQFGGEGSDIFLNQNLSLPQIFQRRLGQEYTDTRLTLGMGKVHPMWDVLEAGQPFLLRVIEAGTAAFHRALALDFRPVKSGEFFLRPLHVKLFDQRPVMRKGPIGEFCSRRLGHRFDSGGDQFLQSVPPLYTLGWCGAFVRGLHSSPYLCQSTGLKLQDREKHLKTPMGKKRGTQFLFQSESLRLKYARVHGGAQELQRNSGTTPAHWQPEPGIPANGGLSI